MDNASDYGSEDSRFESWQVRLFFPLCCIEGVNCIMKETLHSDGLSIADSFQSEDEKVVGESGYRSRYL